MTITDRQISQLRNEARSTEDLVQVHICSVALGDQAPVTTAEAFEERYGGGGFDGDAQATIMAVESVEQARALCTEVLA